MSRFSAAEITPKISNKITRQQGKLVYDDGEYEGDIYGNERDGEGILKQVSEEMSFTQNGTWISNKLHDGKIEAIYPNINSQIHIEIKDGVPKGIFWFCINL